MNERIVAGFLAFAIALRCSLPCFAVLGDEPGKDANIPAVCASVDVAGMDSAPIGTVLKWNNTPDFLAGATVYDKVKGKPSAKLKFEVLKDGVVLIAASWAYEGNAGGGWQRTRWKEKTFVDAGWTPIGGLGRVNKDKSVDLHRLFQKVMKAGEKLDFHTRKYNAPVQMIPAADKVQDGVNVKGLNTPAPSFHWQKVVEHKATRARRTPYAPETNGTR